MTELDTLNQEHERLSREIEEKGIRLYSATPVGRKVLECELVADERRLSDIKDQMDAIRRAAYLYV